MNYRRHLATFIFCAAAAAPASAQTVSGVQYGPLPTQLLDICIPAHFTHNMPAVAVFHGGGWRHGGRASEVPYCMAFASNNVVAFDIDYRLADHTPNNRWPVQLADAQLAMRWIRQNAATYHVDTARICSFGHSAGGQLSLMLGVLSATEIDDMSAILPGVSSQAACTVAISGPTDLTLLAPLRNEEGQTVRELIGPGSPDYVLAQETDASPALRIKANAPNVAPIMLIQGTNDPLVPFVQAVEMSTNLANAGLTAYFLPNDGGHGEAGLPPLEIALIQNTYIRFIKYNQE